MAANQPSEKTVLSQAWIEIKKDYKISQVLGSGSFGQVVKAKDRATGQQVAIKLIQNIDQDDQYLKKVVSEVQTMRKLT